VASDEPEMHFAEGEISALDALKQTLKRTAEWPPDSPMSFVLSLASRTRGKLGEMLLAELASQAGLTTTKATSVAYDVQIGQARCEVKFSTEAAPRFQQVRDPRLEDGSLKYDYLACLSARPHDLVYWLIPATELGDLMDEDLITIQHAMSETRWFWPSRTESDSFSDFRYDYEQLIAVLPSLA